MKNIKFLSGLFLIFIAFSACTNEPIDSSINLNDFNTTPAGPAVFKADFSGSTWVADAASANISGNVISLVGFKGTAGEGFGFQIGGTSVGTYPANQNILAYTPAGSDYGYWSIDPTNAQSNTGSLVITAIDTVNHTISGTFNFTGYWSNTTVSNILPTVFTNGVFQNIPYTTTGGPVSQDSFYTKIDGVEFVDEQIDVATTSSSGFPDSYSIVASKSNGDNVGLSIAQSLAVGTYQITGPFGSQVNSNCLLGGTLYNGDSGSITIVSKTATHMSGTFSIVEKNGTTSETIALTEGTFDVDLP